MDDLPPVGPRRRPDQAAGADADLGTLFTREEVLGGLPARRAQALLFLIESRTAQLVVQARQAMQRFLTDEAALARDLAFIEAFALGREPPVRPSIQDLERYAPRWAPLVPESPQVRAAVARLLGQKYRFTAAETPRLRAALGLDTPRVAQAYERLYGTPLGSVYAPRSGPVERLRWLRAALARWLESLPPFWTAFSLMLTETVGAGILALPIAIAGVGPLPGLALLVVFGLINVLTVVALAEAMSRSGTVRYGNAYFGRVVGTFLGGFGSAIVSLAVMGNCFIILIAYYVGISTTLASATAVPPFVWTAVVFAIGVFFLSRESLDSTVASALGVGAVNLCLIGILTVLALAHLDPGNLAYMHVPLVGGAPFDRSLLQLIFGIIVAAYFGHLSIGNCAKVVLRRDASARSLIAGVIAAQFTTIAIYGLWVVALNGAVPSTSLIGEHGTAVPALARVAGSAVLFIGSVYVVLGMGLASIHHCLGLFNMVQERLPARAQRTVLLPRRRGRLVLRPRGQPEALPAVGLTYLGTEADGPRLRLDIQSEGKLRRVEVAPCAVWSSAELREAAPELHGPGLGFSLEVLQASPAAARLRVATPMALAYEGAWDPTGLALTDVLDLPDDPRRLLSWMLRRGGVRAPEVAARLGQDEAAAHALLAKLAERGAVRAVDENGETRYRAVLAPRRGGRLSEELWRALEVPEPGGGIVVARHRWARWAEAALAGARGRFLVSLSPVAAAFLLTEALLITGRVSYAFPISLVGVIAVSLLAGIFPALLLLATRRKGELVPAVVHGALGHPLLLGLIYTVYLAGILVHGLVIWTGPVERAAAVVSAVAALGLALAVTRRGAFAPRVVVTLREDVDRSGHFTILAGGRPTPAEVRLGLADGERVQIAAAGEIPSLAALRYLAVRLPAGAARELKVWAYRLTEGDTLESLPAEAEVRCGPAARAYDLRLSGGEVVVPLTGEACDLRLNLSQPERA